MNKIFKAIFLLGLFIFTKQLIFAQANDKIVNITVTGSGKTQDDAKQSALRNAIEQAFGAFITGKTEMLNDKVVSDQITSVANGNIQSYIILNEAQLPDGTWASTIKATVSIEKLLSFVNARGANAEVNGGLFTFNIKQQAFNETGEVNAIYDMVGRVHELMQTAYDFKIIANGFEALDAENKNWKIPITVTVTANENINVCADYIRRILKGVSLSETEKQSYSNLKKKIYPIVIKYQDKPETYYLRKEISTSLINSLFSNINFYIRNFTAYRDGVELVEESGESNEKMDAKRKYILLGGGKDGELSEIMSGYASEEIYRYNREHGTDQVYTLISPNQVQANIFWSDFKTSKEIEKIKEYTIKPNGVVSKFKEGGYLVYENNGHGLVVSLSSIGRADFKTAEKLCSELTFGGYSGYRLPDVKELELVADNFVSKYINDAIAMTNHYKSDNAFWTTNATYADSFIPGKKGVIFLKGAGKRDYKSTLSLKIQNIHFETSSFGREENLNILAVRSF